VLRYLTREHFRVLTSIEMGMKNHELVPTQLIHAIAQLKHGGAAKAIAAVHKHKLVYHERQVYDGYKLTYAGYDYLSLHTLTKRDILSSLGNQIGMGKESDVCILTQSAMSCRGLFLHFPNIGFVPYRFLLLLCFIVLFICLHLSFFLDFTPCDAL
jgi:RIO kinase 2